MAFSKVPTDTFASWSEDATNITLPIASVTGLTAAEADGATGDIREILRTLLSTAEAACNGQTDAPTLGTNYFAISKNQSVTDTYVQQAYTVTFRCSYDLQMLT